MVGGIPQYWNGNELHFILDHIDGDASRNDRDNLRLICPNCDNQLPTYKSRNKNSARSLLCLVEIFLKFYAIFLFSAQTYLFYAKSQTVLPNKS